MIEDRDFPNNADWDDEHIQEYLKTGHALQGCQYDLF